MKNRWQRFACSWSLAGDDHEQYSALIDVGAICKSFRNVDVARAVLETIPTVKGVLFYDEMSNKLMALMKNQPDRPRELSSSSPASIKRGTLAQNITADLFAYYDHRRTTGADIPQRAQAAAVLTIAVDTNDRELLQGAMRMRQLMSTQRVTFVVTESAYKRMCGQMELSDVSSKLACLRQHTMEQSTHEDLSQSMTALGQKLGDVLQVLGLGVQPGAL